MESYIQQFSILAVPILLAVTFHEVAHGMVAYRLGDPTARNAGRLTLNPLAHLDLVGTLVFLVTRMIGWAKPVPVNALYFKNPRKGMLWVALAGPATNMALAVLSALLLRWLLNLHLPADSQWGAVAVPIGQMAYVSVRLNVGLAIFNVIPIPPLDGGRIMVGILPEKQAISYAKLESFGFLLLLLLIFSGIVEYVVFPIILAIVNLLLG
ncbi:MAG: site-2 protease family protein [Deltaproteobacteria bacterium]|nr:site-2 protease family protein [Deltaproteobacteria bacterium]